MLALALWFIATLPQLSAVGGTSGSTPEGATANSTCTDGKVAFRGRCVEKDQCCEEDLCPAGSVFEFVKVPKCVPCSDAETQSGASYCAANRATDADRNLNVLYASLAEKFPSERRRLKEAERAWIAFRDKLCEAHAGMYTGGSIEKEIRGRCVAAETNRQIERLKELGEQWTEGRKQNRTPKE